MTSCKQARRVAALLVAATATIAVAGTPSRALTAVAPAPERAGALPPGAQAFAVFRRAPQPGDAMPEPVRAMLAPTAGREQADLDDARAVAPLGPGTVWAIPGPRSVCLAVPDPVDGFGVSCQGYARAAVGELWAALVGGPDQALGDVRVALLLPDGAHHVTAVGVDGASRGLEPRLNVVAAELARAAAIEFTDAAGARRSTAIPGTPPELVADR